MVQWLRRHLPLQGAWAPSLVRELRSHLLWGFPGGTSDKQPTCHCGTRKRHGFDPWVGKIPWRRKWQPTTVSLSGKSHGPWGCRELDMTERLSTLCHVAKTNKKPLFKNSAPYAIWHPVLAQPLCPHLGFSLSQGGSWLTPSLGWGSSLS